MASQPVDYISGLGRLPDPLRDMQEQMATRLGLQQVQLQNHAAQNEMDQQEAFQAAFKRLQDDPSPQNWAAIAVQFPKHAQSVKAAYELQQGPQLKADLTRKGERFSAARSGRWDLVASSLEKEIAATRAAGGEVDEMDQAALDAVKSEDPAKRAWALNYLGTELSMATGPEHFSATYGAVGLKPETPPELQQKYDFLVTTRGKEAADAWLASETSPYKLVPTTEGGRVDIIDLSGSGAPHAVGNSGAASAAAPAPTSGSGLSNKGPLNNPGGLKDGPFARSQPGYKGRNGGFAVFASAEDGVKAQETLLRRNYLNRPTTIRQVIERYAPRSSKGGDNSHASVDNYISYVSSRTGIPADQQIDGTFTASVAKAMREFETGHRGPTQSASAEPVRVRSLQEAMRLPSGAKFYDPQGNLRMKP